MNGSVVGDLRHPVRSIRRRHAHRTTRPQLPPLFSMCVVGVGPPRLRSSPVRLYMTACNRRHGHQAPSTPPSVSKSKKLHFSSPASQHSQKEGPLYFMGSPVYFACDCECFSVNGAYWLQLSVYSYPC